MSTISLLQLLEIWDIERVSESIKNEPDFVNWARLQTVLNALELVRHTPLVSNSQTDRLVLLCLKEFEAGNAKIETPVESHSEVDKFNASFGNLAAFIDLVSEVTIDAQIHTFFRTLLRLGPKMLIKGVMNTNRTMYGSR